MSTDLLDPQIETEFDTDSDTTSVTAAEQLRKTTIAVRFKRSAWGVSKTLSSDQKNSAAGVFHASGQAISASKRLVNTKDERYKLVKQVMQAAYSYWRMKTVPYPEDGIRLLRRDSIEKFEAYMDEMQMYLGEAVEVLDMSLADIKHERQQQLGELYDPSDYPTTLKGLFAIEYNYENTNPDPTLKQMLPEIYEREQQRISAMFGAALAQAEQEFAKELSEIVETMIGQLAEGKAVHGKSVNRLKEFFDRFQELSLGNNEALEEAVKRAQLAIDGVDPKALKDSASAQDGLKTKMSSIKGVLETMLVNKPKRSIALGEDV